MKIHCKLKQDNRCDNALGQPTQTTYACPFLSNNFCTASNAKIQKIMSRAFYCCPEHKKVDPTTI
ncbi:MAG: hypothetical protein WCJ58_00040 [bacterium]